MAEVLGIEVKPLKQKVRVLCAVVEGALMSPTLVDTFVLNSSSPTVAERAYDLATALATHLQGSNIDTVVIRRAEKPPKATNTDGPRERLIVEGALVAFARHKVPDTRLERGKSLAQSRGLTKGALDALGAAVSPDDHHVAAAAAAIAALP